MSDIPEGFEEVIPDGYEEVTPQKGRSVIKDFIAGPDAALSMVAGIPAYIASGYQGLGKLLTTGDIDQAGNEVRRAQESNFGFGAPKPFTPEGKEATEMVGDLSQKAIHGVGQWYYDLTKSEIGRTNAEISTEAALNFLPIPGGKGVSKLARAIEKPFETKPSPKVEGLEKMLDSEKGIPDGYEEVPPSTIHVTPEGDAILHPEDLQYREQALQRVKAEQDAQRTNEGSQMELFDQPEMGRVANPYEAKLGDWRVDENGIPIKADLSMEAANLQAPLQRNLWGDELPQTRNPVGQNADLPTSIDQLTNPAMQEGIPLTEAIDSMPWAQRRGAINRELKGDVQPSGELEGAVAEANRMGGRFGQGGGINPQVFQDLVDAIKNTFSSKERKISLGRLSRTEEPPIPEGMTRLYHGSALHGRYDGPAWFSTSRKYAENYRKDAELQYVDYPTEEINKIIDPDNYGQTVEKGFHANLELDSSVTGLRKSLERINSQKILPSKSGAREIPTMAAEQKPDNINTPRSPENIAARKQRNANLDAVTRNNSAIASKLKDYDSPTTIEEAVANSLDKGDIAGSITGANLTDRTLPGSRFKGVWTGSPLIQYMQHSLRNAAVAAGQFSREFITSKNGLATAGSKLSRTELAEVMEAWQLGDRKQTRLAPEKMKQAGFNQKQIDFMEAAYKADAHLLELENKARRALGMKEIREREGHFPGVFNGGYKTIVKDKNGSIIGVIATDTAWQQKAAQAKMKQLYPDAQFDLKKRYFNQQYTKRTDLGGNAIRSDIYSGMNDVLQILAENDPKFAEVQKKINEILNNTSNSLYGFNRHELDKKGIVGNEGNKPWLSREKNAEQGFKAVIQYFEEGAQHYSLLEPLNELGKAVKDNADALPNTTKYMADHLSHVQGRSVEPIGQAVNMALDALPKALGLSSRIPYKLATELKNRMSGIFMGWGNWAFTATQFGQLGQSFAPFVEMVRARTGMSPTAAVASISAASKDTLNMFINRTTPLKDLPVSEFGKKAFEYAESRGMMDFSEMEKAQSATKSRAMQKLDQVAELNMKVGEAGTRPSAFMGFARMLHDLGLPDTQALRIAENLTQTAMIDYHPWERPRMYSNMGVLGQFAGGLTTFKHGYIGQQALLGREAIKGGPAGRNITPVAASLLSMYILAGMQGMIGYDEADQMVKYLSNKYFGEAKSIRELILNPVVGDHESLKTGLLSTITGQNWQNKFSASDTLPDSLAKAASPHLEAFGKILSNAWEFAKSPDSITGRNLALSISPNGPIKGIMENTLAKGPNGEMIDKQGLPGYPRTPEEWKTRMLTGMVSQKEAIEKQARFENQNKERLDMERKKELAQQMKHAVIAGSLTPEDFQKMRDEYIARGGDVESLINDVVNADIQQSEPQSFRDTGVPANASGVRKYEQYNRKP